MNNTKGLCQNCISCRQLLGLGSTTSNIKTCEEYWGWGYNSPTPNEEIIIDLKNLYNQVNKQFQNGHHGIIATSIDSFAISEKVAEELLKIIKKHS